MAEGPTSKKAAIMAVFDAFDEPKYVKCIRAPKSTSLTPDYELASFEGSTMDDQLKNIAWSGAESTTYLKCNTSSLLSIPMCVRSDYETYKLVQRMEGVNASLPAVPGHMQKAINEFITSDHIFLILLFVGVIFVNLFAGRSARIERKGTIRQLVDIHPKDRSAEVKKLADQMGIMSIYDESESQSESHADVVDDKKVIAPVGPYLC